ncbi:MAG TPA: glycosyltransferase family 87 protein [Anaerolineales bacterium]|nr:glycosyltransferase family 87 protein [Anaerolineales bacterium]
MDTTKNGSLQYKVKADFLLNVALMAVAIFYLTQIGLDLLIWKTMCGNLGGDYCAYWSAGKVANEYGYSEMYKLERLEEFQKPFAPADLPFDIRPVAYLPVFILPFQVLARVNVFAGYGIWALINLAGCVVYLRFFVSRSIRQKLDRRLLLLILLSLSMFSNLFFGQINIWLTICIGEHLRAALSGKPFQAGLWLGGLLIKPHYLILIGLVLLIQRYGKMLTGFMVSATLITSISFLMAGVEGLKHLSRLWLGYASSLPTADPFIMMNWRMVGLNLTDYFGATLAWLIATLGMILTFGMFVYLWRKPILINSTFYPIALLGTIAATTALAWHSHIFSGTILLAPLAYLVQKRDEIPQTLVTRWFLIPPAAQFLAVLLAVIVRESGLPNNLGNLLNFVYSGGQLAVNLSLLYWATVKSWGPTFFVKIPSGKIRHKHHDSSSYY